MVFSTLAVQKSADEDLDTGVQTEHWDLQIDRLNAGGSTAAGAPSVNMFWDWGGNDEWAIGAVAINPIVSPEFTARETLDNDGDGQIDQLRVTTNLELNDDFSDLDINVAGYALAGTPYETGIANDNIFYINLVESGTPDTDATPNVTVVANTLLAGNGGAGALPAGGAAAATDAAEPIAFITRDDPDPTAAASVTFSVDFSEDVSNVDAADFALNLVGVTANPTVIVGNAGDADASTYTVTVDTIAGIGTLGLDFTGGNNIVDGIGNLLNITPATDQVYTKVNSAPVIMSDGGGPTAAVSATENQTSVTTVTYNDQDLPGDTITYSLSGNDVARFNISPAGVLTFIAPPDFDTPTDFDTDGIYDVTVTVDDGNTGTDFQDISVTVLPQNALPVNSVPGSQVLAENATLVFSTANGNLISISDADAGTGDLEVTLSVSDGTLTLFQTTNLSFSVGDGSADAVMTFTGSQTDINLALDGLQYTPTPAWTGNETLTIVTKDMASGVAATAAAEYTFNLDGTDSIGSNDATFNNGAAVVTDNERGNVVETDGVNDYVSMPASVTSGLSDFAFSFWVKTTESGSDGTYWQNPTLLGMETSGQGTGDFGVVTSNGYIGFWTGLSGGPDQSYISATTQINDDQWHMITLANDGANTELYVDGVLEASLTSDGNLDNRDFYLGASNSQAGANFHHSGRFDDFRVFDRELSADDVRDLHFLDDIDSVTITVDPAPVVNNQVFSVDENSSNGTSVDTVIASDNGSVVDYQITAGNTGTAFAINSAGDITVSTSAMLDHETTPIFNLTVEVTDNLGLTNSATITIDVDDLDETPIFGGDDTGAVTEDVGVVANMITTTGNLTITDPDVGESSFQAGTVNGSYGDLVIGAAGNWSYSADNTQAAIQMLDVTQALLDTLTVTSFDGTTHDVVITINGTEDAPVIGGVNTGAVTEDGFLTVSGALTITDVDTNDNPISFNDVAPTLSINGYGNFEITANTWTYTLDNAHASVQPDR